MRNWCVHDAWWDRLARLKDFAPIQVESGFSDTEGTLKAHPTLDGVLVVGVEGGVLLFEPATGNYNNFSR
ncbi:MAG: hypothetical protein WKG00_28870 [Polyangiaceae bacterium]